MLRGLLAVCLVVACCYLLPVTAFALPLPPEAHRTFTGSFWSSVNNLSIPIAGDIQFQLVEQKDVDWSFVDSVDWHFSGSTTDDSFSFAGTLWNDFHNMHPSTKTTWSWYYWTTNLTSMVASGRGAGPDWNVLDNSFFLPAELTYGLRDDFLGMNMLTLSLSDPQVAPVPEPATLLLLGSGMSALFFARRRQK